MTKSSESLTVLSFGGGVNSTGLLVGLVERSVPVDRILFADTGAERPDVYRHVEEVSQWAQRSGYPAIETVRWMRKRTTYLAESGTFLSLEQFCIKTKSLPSLAYGMKGCSVKWKAQVQDGVVKDWKDARQRWERGEKVVRLLGYDAAEAHRAAKDRDNKWFAFRYPLIDWDWDREDCQEAIARAGLQPAAKSACFFCPAHSEKEIAQLGRLYPELLQRALAIEENAESNAGHLVSLQGARGRPWREVWAAAKAGKPLKGRRMDLPCGCFDGEE
mgnify:CR=1 FL=1